MYKCTALIIGAELLTMCAAYAVGRLLKLDRGTIAALMLVGAFGNTGFLGYPVVYAAFDGRGSALFSAVIIDEFGMSLVLTTLGVAVAMRVAQSKSSTGGIVGLLKFPPFIAAIVAMCLRTVYLPPAGHKEPHLPCGRHGSACDGLHRPGAQFRPYQKVSRWRFQRAL